jgi:anti-sigma B factor antagonist
LTALAAYVSFSFQIPEAPMKISTRKIKDIAILDVDGKILLGDGDVEIQNAVEDLLKGGYKNIILNLSKVPYLDSSGLGEMIRCFTTLRKNGGDFKLLSPNRRIIDLLTITKLLNVFDCYEDESSAVASFS